MQIISNLTVFTGTIPDKASQTDNEFANNIFGFLNYSGVSFVSDVNTIANQLNTLSDEIDDIATNIYQNKNFVDEKAQLIQNIVATLPSGAIIDGEPSNINTWSSFKINEYLHNLDLSNIAETTTLKHFTATLKTKLNGIAENANNYTHPLSHDASMITETSEKRFVSDTEKDSWNNKQNLLVSGTSIKTINGNPILGNGDITISTTPTSAQVGTATAGLSYQSIGSYIVAKFKTDANGTANTTYAGSLLMTYEENITVGTWRAMGDPESGGFAVYMLFLRIA
jgi:hypothetical protein